MPYDPLVAAQALSRLNEVESRFLQVQEERRRAIVEAARADIPLRDVASAARCSHETVRRIVAADGEVTVEFAGRSYLLGGQTVELLIYKLAGHANGTFAADPALLDAGDGWLPAAGALANELHASMADEEGAPLILDDARAFALHQVLRHTGKGNPSVLSDLAEALTNRYGFPPYARVPTLRP